MSRNMERMSTEAASGGTERAAYRQAEATLWAHYGVEAKERFVETRSPAALLRVLDVGSGPPVLFVHGTGGVGPYWGSLVRELTGFRCLLLDRPGWGLSSAIDYSQHDYRDLTANLLKEVLDGLGIERAHVVGASVGDVWALRVAQRFPSRVGAVALLGSAPLLPDFVVPKIFRLMRSPMGRIMVRLPENPTRVRSIMRSLGHGPSLDDGRIADQYVSWHVALTNGTDGMRHERAMLHAILDGKHFDPRLTFDPAELASIPQPTLMVLGTGDPYHGVQRLKRFMALLPRGELHVMDGGHLPWLDDPKGVASALADHFRANPA